MRLRRNKVEHSGSCDWLFVSDASNDTCLLPEAVAPPMMGGAHPDPPQLCPYAAAGHCYYEERCTYLHGDQCNVCGLQVLHPHDPDQRRTHEKVCAVYKVM